MELSSYAKCFDGFSHLFTLSLFHLFTFPILSPF